MVRRCRSSCGFTVGSGCTRDSSLAIQLRMAVSACRHSWRESFSITYRTARQWPWSIELNRILPIVPATVIQLSVQQASERLKEINPPRIIDVRERDEWELAHISGSEL